MTRPVEANGRFEQGLADHLPERADSARTQLLGVAVVAAEKLVATIAGQQQLQAMLGAMRAQ